MVPAVKHNPARFASLAHVAEVGCWLASVALVAVYLGAHAFGDFERIAAITAFEATYATPPASARASSTPDETHLHAAGIAIAEAPGMYAPSRLLSNTRGAIGSPDQVVVALARVETDAADTTDTGSTQSMPVALLRIPRVGIEVPVYPNTSERNLNRGAGLVEGTAMPGSDGNIAIAAHRDRHFRALQDIAVGDVLELQSPAQRRRYRVSDISIVAPTDVSPLAETTEAAVTLVTCYPFRFVGNAPQRFIVRALAER